MRRYTFYIFIALLTFGIGSFIVLNMYWRSEENLYTPTNAVSLNRYTDQPDFRKSFVKYYDSSQEQEAQTKKLEKPFCKDKRILQVWNTLIQDKDFQDWEPISKESLDCADTVEVKKIDLNRDGTKEFLLRGKSLCSPVGNCGFWVYEKKGNKFKKLLYSTDQWEMTDLPNQVKKSRTNGYFDILLKGHFTASETTYQYYKFVKGKYKLTKDLIETCIVCSGDNPKWKMMTWKEYEKLYP